MKFIGTICLFITFLVPAIAVAKTIETQKIVASIEDNGNWKVTEKKTRTSWQGEWLDGHDKMKVSGDDGSCFIIKENESGMVKLDCVTMEQIEVLVSYN